MRHFLVVVISVAALHACAQENSGREEFVKAANFVQRALTAEKHSFVEAANLYRQGREIIASIPRRHPGEEISFAIVSGSYEVYGMSHDEIKQRAAEAERRARYDVDPWETAKALSPKAEDHLKLEVLRIAMLDHYDRTNEALDLLSRHTNATSDISKRSELAVTVYYLALSSKIGLSQELAREIDSIVEAAGEVAISNHYLARFIVPDCLSIPAEKLLERVSDANALSPLAYCAGIDVSERLQRTIEAGKDADFDIFALYTSAKGDPEMTARLIEAARSIRTAKPWFQETASGYTRFITKRASKMSVAYLRAGDTARAEDHLEQLTPKEQVEALLDAGRYARIAGAEIDARELIDQALAIFGPEDTTSSFGLVAEVVKALRDAGRDDEARQVISEFASTREVYELSRSQAEYYMALYGFRDIATAAWGLGLFEIAIEIARDLPRLSAEGREVLIRRLRAWALDLSARPSSEDTVYRLHLIASAVPGVA